ncbi:MAG TPA: hypothetical protein VN436_03985, partial [Holophaga sp.]|nr:hypothetical protein [Holophaga sp.]
LDQLGDADLASVDPRLTPEVRSVLDVRQALLSRCGAGGTSPERVAEQIAALEQRAEGFSDWAALVPGGGEVAPW